MACVFLALATYQCFYPIMLIFPLCICLAQRRNDVNSISQIFFNVVFPTVSTFLLAFGALNVLSYELMGKNWSFLGSTHGFILSVPELTPNIGLFWYFFTDMFEQFSLFPKEGGGADCARHITNGPPHLFGQCGVSAM